MVTRSYTARRGRKGAPTVDRVLEAAERLIRDDEFHTATMDEIAAAAGVSRATVFNRFGTKLGLLQALFDRATASPEVGGIHVALALDDPVESLVALIEATSATWEVHGYVHEQLQAIVVLEPAAGAPLEQHQREQRQDLQRLVRRLARADRFRPGLGEARATAALHALTSLETFVRLRREHHLSTRQARRTIAELAQSLLRDD